jgi:hypothetical protein
MPERNIRSREVVCAAWPGDVRWNAAMPANQLIIFVKAPRPGTVKTRLAQTLGAEAACAAYRRLVETLLSHLWTTRNVEVRFTPDDAFQEIAPWLRAGWKVSPQAGGDLGERLVRAFQDAFVAGARRVVIIGSDCPDILKDDIEAAWASLKKNDVVLGPASDGGYWLIGLCAAAPSLFEGVPWSSAAVLQQTCHRARAAGLTVELLRELHDVDTIDDWQRFLRSAR